MSRDDTSRLKTNQRLTVTQIKDDQFLVETEYNNIRIGGESEYYITYISIDNGPSFHLGKDFLGTGIISRLEIIEPDNTDNYIIIKIITQEENTNDI